MEKLNKTKDIKEETPKLVKFLVKYKKPELYSDDKKTQYLLEIFLNCLDICNLKEIVINHF